MAPALRSSRDHHGIPRRLRGHGADYERVRRTLLGQPCHWCGRRADSADYRIPWSQGGTLADLVPACSPCNYRRGAQLTNAKRRQGGGRSDPSGGAPQRTASVARVSRRRVSRFSSVRHQRPSA